MQELLSEGEPTLEQLRVALVQARLGRPDFVLAVGGGATIDLGKAISALVRLESDPVVHLEVIGEGRSIPLDPLPFVAVPTTAGTGAEATRNAVISVPDRAIKVSLRDDRMMPYLAIVDPALTDSSPKQVTIATGLDAITQLIESYFSQRANPITDALCESVLPGAMSALLRLMEAEDPGARDALSKASYLSGIALANVGLGIVHGLAGVIGGHGGAHGALCGRLLPAAMTVNAEALQERGLDVIRLSKVQEWFKSIFDERSGTGSLALRRFIDDHGLPSLEMLGCRQDDHRDFARLAMTASSTKTNPVPLTEDEIVNLLHLST